jgi:excisionase family DNA binding protein
MDNPFEQLLQQLYAIREEQAVIKSMLEAKKEEVYLTSKQVCSRLGITFPTLNNHCKAGTFKKHYVGSKVLFKETEVDLALKTFKKFHPITSN